MKLGPCRFLIASLAALAERISSFDIEVSLLGIGEKQMSFSP